MNFEQCEWGVHFAGTALFIFISVVTSSELCIILAQFGFGRGFYNSSCSLVSPGQLEALQCLPSSLFWLAGPPVPSKQPLLVGWPDCSFASRQFCERRLSKARSRLAASGLGRPLISDAFSETASFQNLLF